MHALFKFTWKFKSKLFGPNTSEIVIFI